MTTNPMYKELTQFLGKFGILLSNNQNLFNDNKEEFSEKVAINGIKNYLLQCEINSKFDKMSNLLYEKYIDFDDENVIKTVRKLFVIYSRRHKKIKLDYWLKWKFNAMTVKTKTTNFIYKKKISKETKNNLSNSNIRVSTEEISYDITKAENFSISSRLSTPVAKSLKLQSYSNKQKSNQNSLDKRPEFKLYINKNNTQSNSPRNYLQKAPRKISKQEQMALFNSLYNESKSRQEKIRQLSLQKEKRFNSVYTFTPEFVSNHRRNSSKGVEENFYQRLNDYQRNKNLKIKKIKEEIENTRPKPKNIPNKSFQSHLIPNSMNYFQNKKEKIEKIEREIIEEQGITFKPNLNEEINQNIRGSVIERNEEFMKNKEMRLSKHKEDSECTFTPKINRFVSKKNNNSSIVTEVNSESYQPPQKVGDRLFEYQNKYNEKLENIKNIYREEYPFKPEISKNTNEILKNKQKLMEEIKNRYKYEQDEGEMKKINELSEEDLNSIANYEKSEQRPTEPKLCLTGDKINSLPSITDVDKKSSLVSSEVKNSGNLDQLLIAKGLSSEKGIDNLSDEKLLQLAKNYLSMDESLEKFQYRFKNKFASNSGTASNSNRGNQNPSQGPAITGIDSGVVVNTNQNFKKGNFFLKSETKEQRETTKSSNLSGAKALMQNLDYYDNL